MNSTCLLVTGLSRRSRAKAGRLKRTSAPQGTSISPQFLMYHKPLMIDS